MNLLATPCEKMTHHMRNKFESRSTIRQVDTNQNIQYTWTIPRQLKAHNKNINQTMHVFDGDHHPSHNLKEPQGNESVHLEQ